MFAAKIGMKPFLRDSAAASFTKPKLPMRLLSGHCFLCALRRMRGATVLLPVPRLLLSPALLLSPGFLLFFRLRLLLLFPSPGLLFRGIVLLLFPLLSLLTSRLRLFLLGGLFWLLPLRLGWLLPLLSFAFFFLLLWLSLFFLLVRLFLPCHHRPGNSQRQQKRTGTNNFDAFHLFSPLYLAILSLADRAGHLLAMLRGSALHSVVQLSDANPRNRMNHSRYVQQPKQKANHDQHQQHFQDRNNFFFSVCAVGLPLSKPILGLLGPCVCSPVHTFALLLSRLLSGSCSRGFIPPPLSQLRTSSWSPP